MAEFDIVDLSAETASDSLTPQQHLERADRAYAAAQKLRREMDAHEQERGATLGKSTPEYLAIEQVLLTLFQIANLHANMATAKSLLALSRSSMWPGGANHHG